MCRVHGAGPGHARRPGGVVRRGTASAVQNGGTCPPVGIDLYLKFDTTYPGSAAVGTVALPLEGRADFSDDNFSQERSRARPTSGRLPAPQLARSRYRSTGTSMSPWTCRLHPGDIGHGRLLNDDRNVDLHAARATILTRDRHGHRVETGGTAGAKCTTPRNRPANVVTGGCSGCSSRRSAQY